jgi:hypothetical protein
VFIQRALEGCGAKSDSDITRRHWPANPVAADGPSETALRPGQEKTVANDVGRRRRWRPSARYWSACISPSLTEGNSSAFLAGPALDDRST